MSKRSRGRKNVRPEDAEEIAEKVARLALPQVPPPIRGIVESTYTPANPDDGQARIEVNAVLPPEQQSWAMVKALAMHLLAMDPSLGAGRNIGRSAAETGPGNRAVSFQKTGPQNAPSPARNALI